MKRMNLRKGGTRMLALLLVLTLLVGIAPAAVFAADSTSDSQDDGFFRIVHLDCGRKYFSANWIKALIREMAAAGYNQLQLAFGNDGLRFLLDDMSFTANGTTYDHATVVSKVEAGNKAQNSSGDASWLTQSEMDDIIAEANKYGIEIVPLLNLPGHANAILDIVDDKYNASGSNNTLNVASSEEARNFGYAILQKYVDYFAGKGCKYFNFGADEYANDASGTFSFSRLNSSEYQTFVKFINKMATIIKDAGMTPRAFNDGLYYDNQSAEIDTDIQCCYWSSGWGSYPVASASTIAAKGHKMINTNGDYYYVLSTGSDGKINTKFATDGYTYASGFSNTAFMGSTVSNPAGSMFCIWCDQPNLQTEQEVAATIRMPLRAMAARMQDKSIDTISDSSVVINGGFASDGSIYTAIEEEIVPITSNGITIAAQKSLKEAEITCTVTIGSETVSVKWTITLTDTDGNPYKGKARITLDMTNDMFAEFLSVVDLDTLAVSVDGTAVSSTVADIQVDTQAQTITFTTPHFSEITLTGDVKAGETPTTGTTINLEVGGSAIIDLTDYTGTTGSQTTDNASIATAEIKKTESTTASVNQNVTSITSGSKYLILPNTPNGKVVTSNISNGYNNNWTEATGLLIQSVTINSNNVDNLKQYAWTITQSGDKYTVQNANGKYLNIVSNNTLNLSDTKVELNIGWSNGKVYFKNDSGCYLNNFGGGNTFASGYTETLGNGDCWTLYEVVEDTEASTTLTITGTGEGTTTVTVGGTEYTINVTAPKSESSYTLGFNQTKTLPDGAANVTITDNSDACITLSGKTITAGETAGTATVTFVTKNAGEKVTAYYTWHITVAKEDLSNVRPVTIEYWITNSNVCADSNPSIISGSITAQDAYGENGVLISTLVPQKANKRTNETTVGSEEVVFWKATRLKYGNKQVTGDGVDKTLSGEDFKYIRYYNGQWAFSADGVDWTSINTTDQLVAYYLQITDVTDEVTTEVVDWGHTKDESNTWGTMTTYYSQKYVLVDYSVKLESGTEIPNSFPVDKTLAFHCNTSDTTSVFKDNSTRIYYRRIGLVAAENTAEYEMYMITVTPTSDDASTMLSDLSTSITYTYAGTETVVWAISQEVLDDSGLDLYKSISGNFVGSVGGDSVVPGLEIYSMHGMKVTYYVRAKVTEDSLTVHYIDRKGGNIEFYNYSIAVNGGTVFDPSFARNSDGTLVGNTVTTINGKTETVSSDLKSMPAISPAYRLSQYTCDDVKRSEDGKDVYLYYNFDNWSKSFVVDFGLPLKITGTDLKIEHESSDVWVSSAVSGAMYGTVENVINENNRTSSYLLYTPTEILPETESLQLILYYGENKTNPVVYLIYLVPASTVYYEDDFVQTTNGVIAGETSGVWGTDGKTETDVYQALSALGSGDRYGYDKVYADGTMFSLGSAKKVTVTKDMEEAWTDGSSWPTATFTFTGTGFDVISLTSNTSGLITYEVKDSKGETKMSKFVTNYYGYDYVNGGWVSATGDNALYQLPVIRVDDLGYGTYTVTITAAYGSFFDSTKNGEYSFWLDGVRVYGTLEDSSIYKDDHEAYPQFIELHDVLCDISKVNGTYTGPCVITSDDPENPTLADYVAKGPNHEVYLECGDSLAFKLTGEYIDKVMIGMKAVDGAAEYTINGTAGELNTATDMYYDITKVAKAGVVTISNTGDTILSLTTVKVTFTQESTATMEMTEAEAQTALMMVRAVFAPVTFTPERLEASWLVSTVRAGQKAILTIKTSEDVEAVIVNGEELTSYRTRRNRSGETWREFSWATTATETMDYAVSAVNADGIESEPVIVTLTVKAASGHTGLRDWISGIFSRLF